MSQTHRIRLVWLAAFGLVAYLTWPLGSSAAEVEGQSCAEEPLLHLAAADGSMSSTGETAPPTGDVQERAVPRMGPGGMAPALPRQDIGGGVIENNRLMVKPGYVLEVLPNNQALLKPAGGGGPGVTVSCVCSKGMGGGCKLVGGAGSAYCEPSGFSKCKGTCSMKYGAQSSPGMVIQ